MEAVTETGKVIKVRKGHFLVVGDVIAKTSLDGISSVITAIVIGVTFDTITVTNTLNVLAVDDVLIQAKAEAIAGSAEIVHTPKAPINVNIFIKNISNGMVNRNLAKDVQSKVEQSLNNYKSHKPNGQYLVLEKESSESINNAKKGFFCINIKLIVSIEK